MIKLLQSVFCCCLCFSFILMFSGCPNSEDPVVLKPKDSLTQEQLLELANRPLKVLCVGSSAWTDEMVAQYTGRYDGKIEISPIELATFQGTATSDLIKFDVLIVPPAVVPSMAADRQLFEIRPESLQRLNENSMLTGDRDSVRYDKGIYGVSLGSPLQVVYHSDTDFASDYLSGNNSWQNWHDSAVKANADSLQFIEPMSGFGAAKALLFRGGAYARSRTQVSMYFNKSTGESRINTEPFVAALMEMKEEYGKHVDELKNMTPLDAFKKIQASEVSALMTGVINLNFQEVSKPQQASENSAKSDIETRVQQVKDSALASFAQATKPVLSGWSVTSVPASNRYYNLFTEEWVKRTPTMDSTYQFVGLDGRVACIVRNTRKAESAMRFLEILTNSPTAESIAPFADSVGPAKSQQLDQISTWFGKAYSAEALEQIRRTYTQANQSQGATLLTFPATDEHFQRLEKLNQVVLDALAGKMEPKAALDSCAKEWDQISKSGKNRVKTLLSKQ